MRNLNVLRYGIIALCLLFFSTTEAKMNSNTASNDLQTLVQQKSKKKKLSLKERWAMKRLKKMQQKQSKAKSPQGEQLLDGLLWKVILGAILIVVGVFSILTSLFTFAIGSLFLSIALIVVGVLIIAWGALDVVL